MYYTIFNETLLLLHNIYLGHVKCYILQISINLLPILAELW